MLPLALIRSALKHPATCLVDGDLRRGRIDTDLHGLPQLYGGRFAVTCRLTVDARVWAIRILRLHDEQRLKRWELVERFLRKQPVEPLPKIRVLRDGIRCGEQCCPLIEMPWIEGKSLAESARDQHHDPGALRALARSFVTAGAALESAGVAHGDLHPGNIRISPSGAITFIDLDAMFLPGMEGLESLELGHIHFSSPRRSAKDFGTHLDRFSVWLIADTLRILSEDPLLWRTIGPGNPRLDPEGWLLRGEDLRSPQQSAAFAALLTHRNPKVRNVAMRLRSLIELPLHAIPSPFIDDSNRPRTQAVLGRSSIPAGIPARVA